MSEMALRSFDVNIIVPPKAVYHGAIGEMGNLPFCTWHLHEFLPSF